MLQYTMIMLHGLGADSDDMKSLGELILEGLDTDDFRLICPDAPMQSVSINHHVLMPAWYDIYQLDQIEPEDD